MGKELIQLIEEVHLEKIFEKVSFLPQDKSIKNLIIKVNTFYYFRYPITQQNQKDRSWWQKQLTRIGDNVRGIPVQPREIGTDDWDKVSELYNALVESMPKDLHAEWLIIDQKFKSFS